MKSNNEEDVIDPETGEVLPREYKIPVKNFKREYLEVPEKFIKLIRSSLDKEPLFFKDTVNEIKFIADLYPAKRLLGGLGEWYRRNSPDQESLIIIKLVNRNENLFEIFLEQEKEEEKIEGIFLGNQYNMVGGRKYEAEKKYYTPLSDLLTHVFICGITGSGKTVLGKIIVEEAALRAIPTIIIDLKGDLSSLGLIIRTSDDLKMWVKAKDEELKEFKVKEIYRKHYEKLIAFGITREKIEDFHNKIDFRVFTPRSKKGIQLGFASPLGAPPYPIEMYKINKEDFNSLVASLTNAFMDRLYPGTKKTRIENERNYLFEIVHHAWLNGINLKGADGMMELLRLVEEPPFQEIGGLPVSQYIDAENRRKRLLNKINTMLSGPEKMWFEGTPMEINIFLKAESEKVPVNVINLTDLDNFEDRSFVVAQVAYEINKWMRKYPSEEPQLIFFIDEIGGGGGKQALFPSFPYECAAKWGLNYLIRQGRAFGVCCILATQNPGDVDYKGLSNCQTWMIGKLATDRDRKKVMEGMEVWGSDAERVKHNLTNAQTGDFVIKTPRGELNYIKERWLMSYHRVLSLADIEKIYINR
ncbi:MAG: ATP-binding protein [Nitrospirae bacterium]|nr:ATP-binding protein [Nitrospirota bacterium]